MSIPIQSRSMYTLSSQKKSSANPLARACASHEKIHDVQGYYTTKLADFAKKNLALVHSLGFVLE